MDENEFIITSNPFEGSVHRVLTFVREHGKGPEAEQVLQREMKRFCKDPREEEIMKEAYESGVLKIRYYPVVPKSQDSSSMSARVR